MKVGDYLIENVGAEEESPLVTKPSIGMRKLIISDDEPTNDERTPSPEKPAEVVEEDPILTTSRISKEIVVEKTL